MIHLLRHFAGVFAIVALATPSLASPVIAPLGKSPVPRSALDLPLVTVNCENPEPEYEPPSESEGFDSFDSFDLTQDAPFRIYKACDGSGQNIDPPGPELGDAAEISVKRGIAHCSAYTDVWRVDCLSNELERMANQLPNDRASAQAKADIRAAAEKLRMLAEQNADPAQPAVRRSVELDGKKRTTTRPITAVAPERVVATNLAADQVITELSTTLLRSASSSNAAEFTRVAAAVDSTKVLLRST